MAIAEQNASSSDRNIVFIILLCLAFSVLGCKPSSEQKQAEREAERKEYIRKKEAQVKLLSDQILGKHNSIYFPPEGLGATAFTYELQKFFSTYAERAVLFKAYLEDVEKTESGIIVEFLCPLGEHFYIHKIAVRFRLTAAAESVEHFLGVKREDPLFRSIRYFSEPDYFVVARIDDLRKDRRYELDGSMRKGELEISVKSSQSFISTGELIEAIPISHD
jgi:hypothetical protein